MLTELQLPRWEREKRGRLSISHRPNNKLTVCCFEHLPSSHSICPSFKMSFYVRISQIVRANDAHNTVGICLTILPLVKNDLGFYVYKIQSKIRTGAHIMCLLLIIKLTEFYEFRKFLHFIFVDLLLFNSYSQVENSILMDTNTTYTDSCFYHGIAFRINFYSSSPNDIYR